MATQTNVLTKEQLAERYATLAVQQKTIERQMRETADELICMMSDSELIRTPEYTVSRNQGRKFTTWTEAGKLKKKEFEAELIRQKLMEEKTGESYIQCRFTKQAEAENS